MKIGDMVRVSDEPAPDLRPEKTWRQLLSERLDAVDARAEAHREAMASELHGLEERLDAVEAKREPQLETGARVSIATELDVIPGWVRRRPGATGHVVARETDPRGTTYSVYHDDGSPTARYLRDELTPIGAEIAAAKARVAAARAGSWEALSQDERDSVRHVQRWLAMETPWTASVPPREIRLAAERYLATAPERGRELTEARHEQQDAQDQLTEYQERAQRALGYDGQDGPDPEQVLIDTAAQTRELAELRDILGDDSDRSLAAHARRAVVHAEPVLRLHGAIGRAEIEHVAAGLRHWSGSPDSAAEGVAQLLDDLELVRQS